MKSNHKAGYFKCKWCGINTGTSLNDQKSHKEVCTKRSGISPEIKTENRSDWQIWWDTHSDTQKEHLYAQHFPSNKWNNGFAKQLWNIEDDEIQIMYCAENQFYG